MKKAYLLIFIFLGFNIQNTFCQEIKYSFKVNSDASQVADKSVFSSLERTVNDFLNNTKWSEEEYEQEERINCQITLTIKEEVSEKDFKAKLNILATRPVYASTYETVLFQHNDEALIFSYEPGIAIIYNQNAYLDQLSSVLAYYSYIILGLDKDSFSDRGGDQMYVKAQNIVSLLPSGYASKGEFGWNISGTSSNTSRYFFLENLQSNKFSDFRAGFYEYFRHGLDIASKDIFECRKNMVNAVRLMEKTYDVYPNALMINTFFAVKAREVNDIFKSAERSEKQIIFRIFNKVSPTSTSSMLELQ